MGGGYVTLIWLCVLPNNVGNMGGTWRGHASRLFRTEHMGGYAGCQTIQFSAHLCYVAGCPEEGNAPGRQQQRLEIICVWCRGGEWVLWQANVGQYF